MNHTASEERERGSSRQPWTTLAVVGLISIGGCSGATDPTDDVGVARVALSEAPTDVRCLEITARGVRQVVKKFEVTPGTSELFEMVGLPVGEVQFNGAAFEAPCSSLASTSAVPTWVGDPVVATIAPGVVAPVTLVLHRNGRGSIAVDFRDCAEGLVDLGSLSGASDIAPIDMNDLGQVAGNTGVDAFLWSAGTMTALGLGAGSTAIAINNRGQILARDAQGRPVVWDHAVASLVGELGGGWADAAAMNDSVQVVGRSLTPAGDSHAFLWQPGSAGIIDLGTLGNPYSAAFAINAAGQVVGDSDTTTFERHGFLWEAGTLRDLGSLGGGWSSPTAINDAGQVIGQSSLANGETHAFLWGAGGMQDLGTLGGDWSSAAAVSATGQVVGQSNLVPGGSDSHAFIWEAGEIRDLGTVGGTWSTPGGRRSINDAGEVVGWAETALGEVHAFIWKAAPMNDLGTLGVPTTNALGINRAHQIFGSSATSSGRQRGFFFDPTKCPPAGGA